MIIHNCPVWLITPEHEIGQQELRHIDVDTKKCTYDDLLEPLFGQRIFTEHVNVLLGNDLKTAEHRDMFVDEDGRMKGLPFNKAATRIYLNATYLNSKSSARDQALAVMMDPRRTNWFIAGLAIVFPAHKVWR